MRVDLKPKGKWNCEKNERVEPLSDTLTSQGFELVVKGWCWQVLVDSEYGDRDISESSSVFSY